MTEEEFKDTVLPHHQMMMAEAFRILRNKDEAIDCVQDALTSIWKSRKSLPQISNVRAYCVKAAVNRALEMTRSGRLISDPPDNNAIPDNSSTPAEVYESSEKISLLRKAVGMLPEIERRVIILKAVKGMSGGEIAQTTGLSHANVRVIIHRARKRLRQYLDDNQ